MQDVRLALVDIGSNTVRLVIFSCDRYFNVSEMQNIKVPARLALYLEEDGQMNDEGIRILLQTLDRFMAVIEQFDVEEIFFVATAAIRLSSNVDDIKEKVEKLTGISLRVLSGEEEAYYGNYAIRHTMNFKKGISIDIGGGSTELVLYEHDRPLETISLPFGAVTLKEKFFSSVEHNDEKALKKARKFIKKQLEEIDFLQDSGLALVGIGGSVRNIAEVHQRANNYPIAGIHGYRMSQADINETLDIFCSRTMSDLDDLDGLSKERKDTIVPANLVFQQIMSVSDSKNLYISHRGLREGFIMHYINQSYDHPYGLSDIPGQSIVRIARKYRVSSYAVNQRFIIADLFIRELERNNILRLSDKEIRLLYYGTILYYVGKYIEDDGWSQHTFYVLSNISMSGFNQKERVTIALIASFKNKSLYKQYIEDFQSWFSSVELERIMYFGGIVKFSEALNDAQVNHVQNMSLEAHDDGDFTLYVDYSGDLIAESYRANKQKNHVERFLNGDLTIVFNENVN